MIDYDYMFIEQDYQKAQGMDVGNDYNDVVSRFFDGEDYTFPLANNIGTTALNTYVEFVMSNLFPDDGSWLGIMPKDNTVESARKAKKVVSALHTKLLESNFYQETLKLIKSGALYNKGYMDISYNFGLNFKTIYNDDLKIIDKCSYSYQRAYASKYVSLMELSEKFEGDFLELEMASVTAQNKEKLNTMYKLISAIVPCTEPFVTKKKKYKAKFVKVYFLDHGGLQPLKKIGEDKPEGFNSFPVMTYSPALSESLACSAKSLAVLIEDLTSLMLEVQKRSAVPPMTLDMKTWKSGNFDLSAGGVTPLLGGEREPKPVQTSTSLELTTRDLQYFENRLREVFKLNLIDRSKTLGLSSYEAAGVELAAISAIAPVATNLVTCISHTGIKRIHTLLMENDKEYKKEVGDIGEDIVILGLQGKVKKLENIQKLGMLAQTATPYIQANRSSGMVLNSDNAIRLAAASLELPSVIRSQEQTNQARQVQAERANRAQELEQQKTEAETNKLEKEAE